MSSSLVTSPSAVTQSSSKKRERRSSFGAGRNNHCVSEFFSVVTYGSSDMLLGKIQESIRQEEKQKQEDRSTSQSITPPTSSTSTNTITTANTPLTTPTETVPDVSSPPSFVQWMNDFRFKGEVVDRYPMATVSASGTQFPDGIPMFCMPSGLLLSYSPPPPSYFCFVTTASSGERLYGHCLTIHDPMPVDLVDTLINTYDNWIIAPSSSSPSSSTTTTTNNNNNNFSSSSGKSSTVFSVSPTRGKTLFASKCLCLITKFPFLVQCHKFLTSLYQITMSVGDIPIERYVCNFINEVPLPPPGKAEVQYGIADQILIFTRPPLNKPILDVDLPFRRVFECLTPSTIITLFKCLLLEQKILMHSYRLSLLTDVAELLQAFMYPMSWGHVYVPVLPRGLFDVIKAPMPFLLGTNSEWMDEHFINDILNQVDDVITLDIDTSTINVPEWLNLPPLPSRERKKLDKQLQETAQPVYDSRGGGDDDMWKATTWNNYDSAFRFAARPCDVSSDDVLSSDNLLVLRDHFFRFFVSLLRNYEKHIKRPSNSDSKKKKNIAITTTAKKNAQQPWFDKDSFLKEQSRSDRPFISQFLNSQACTNFINECMHEPSYDVVFFNEKIIEKRNRSRWVISRKPATPFLKNKEFAVSKTVVCAAPDISGLTELLKQEEEKEEILQEMQEVEENEERSPRPTTKVDSPTTKNRRRMRKIRKSLRSQSFPTLRPHFFIDPRPTPELPDDGGDALSSLHARRTGKTNNLWLIEATNNEDSIYYDFSATVHSIWFLAFTAMLDPSEHAERHLSTATTPTVGIGNSDFNSGGSNGSNGSCGSSGKKSSDGKEMATPLPKASSHDNLQSVLGNENVSPASPRTTKRRTSRRFSRSFDGSAEFDYLVAADAAATPTATAATTVTTLSPPLSPEEEQKKNNIPPPAIVISTLSPPCKSKASSETTSTTGTPTSVTSTKAASPAITPRGKARTDSSMASSRKVEKERKSSQLLLLSRAFDVLDRMKARYVDRDDFVYRALIDASCRIGSTHHAMTVLKEMRHDRLRPSALFFSCLLSAFAMDGTLKSGAGEQLPMGELTAWMNESAESSAPSVDSRTEQRKGKKGGHERRKSIIQQVEGAMIRTPKTLNSRSASVKSSSKVEKNSLMKSSSEGSNNSSVSSIMSGISNESSKTALTPLTLDFKNGNLSHPGYSLLQTLFPSLHIETDMETCPKCSKGLNRKF
jgi:pentatricopeptide repeat protein